MTAEDAPRKIEGLVCYLEAQYGDRFNEERIEDLHGAVAGQHESGEALRKVNLSNDDAPAFTFHAYRSDE